MTMKGSGWKGLQAVINSLTLVLLGMFLVSTTSAAERVEYYHTDALGSVVAATDESGGVLWREAYQPFGKRIDNEVSSKDNTPFYTGKPHDDGTGLSYFGARYYDPFVGRFLGTDPVDVDPNNLHSFNRFAYANNNPYTFVDPDGRNPKLILDFALNVGLNYYLTGKPNFSGAAIETAKGALNPLKTFQNVSKILKLAAKRGTTTLYRAVGPDELADIQKTGQLINRGSAEGKYFTTSAEHASDYAKQAVKAFGDAPYTTVKTKVPTSSLPSPVSVDGGIPAYVVPNNALPGLKPSVLNSMAIPR